LQLRRFDSPGSRRIDRRNHVERFDNDHVEWFDHHGWRDHDERRLGLDGEHDVQHDDDDQWQRWQRRRGNRRCGW